MSLGRRFGLQAKTLAALLVVGLLPVVVAWWVMVAIPDGSVAVVVVSLGVAAGLIIAVLAVPLSNAVRRPVVVLAEAARRICAGELGYRIPPAAADEVGDLAVSFNTMADQLGVKIEELKESRHRLLVVQEEVRRQVAEELHGRVQTRLLVLEHRLAQLGEVTLQEEVDELREDVRSISHRLHPSIVQVGLGSALRSLRDRFEEMVPVDVTFGQGTERLELGMDSAVWEVKLAVFRVVEEVLMNVAKHSRATHAHMQVDVSEEEVLRVQVRDNGVGFDPQGVEAGVGLRLIRDYTEAVGGTHWVETEPGKGTTIGITVPLDRGERSEESSDPAAKQAVDSSVMPGVSLAG